MDAKIRVVVVDDHPMVLRGTCEMIEEDPAFEVVAKGRDGDEALALVSAHRPDVLLMDIHMPRRDGVSVVRDLRAAGNRLGVVMLTSADDEATILSALRAGADGYLLKTVESHHLCEAIVKVMDGESVVSPEMTTKLVSALRAQPPAQSE
ncbi:MAG: response regulator transcription factor, partial [Candidatus Sericytochromatia bacterium]